MPVLTNHQKDLLSAILSESGPASARTNALKFRVAHEDAIADLDELESRQLIARKDNKYSLRLLTLVEIESQNSKAESILFLCGHLFGVLRRMYKEDPGQQIPLSRLVEAAELPISEITKGLSYLVEAPIFGAYSTDLSAAEGFVTPSEAILKYKAFEEVVEQLRQWAARSTIMKVAREKQQKFGILDSPTSLASDLAKPSGALGRAVIYLDLDNFKALNTKLTEAVVDEIILPPIHRLLSSCVQNLGYAYGEGGDEFTMLLPNTSETIAITYAEEVRLRIEKLNFEDVASAVRISASVGVAHGTPEDDGKELKQRANLAKNHAKENGKNCVATWAQDHCQVVKGKISASQPAATVIAAHQTGQQEIAVLNYLARTDVEVPLEHIVAELQVSRNRAKYVLEQLQEWGFVDVILNMAHGPKYSLSRKGRRYLAEQGLLK